ncbi:hypothetical protein [Dyella sp. 333MFSha]|uniref:hypothetical protein n=1 Tax=Dyella sp. 333MFSha TaxID=1798240 RepID=UPI00115F8018|nr:hypothetical protein [Dyella sp. 333MFSha]
MNAAASICFFGSLGLTLARFDGGASRGWLLTSGFHCYETTYFSSLAELWRFWRHLSNRILMERELARCIALQRDGVSRAEADHVRAWIDGESVGYPYVIDRLSAQIFKSWKQPVCWRMAMSRIVEPAVNLNFGSNFAHFFRKS